MKFHRPGRIGIVAAAVLGISITGPLSAEESADAARAAEACTWSHTGGQLAGVLCEPGLEQTVWAAAGGAACAGHQLCAAWVYEDPTALPDPMPDRFEGLTQANVTSAVAVWVEEDDYLIVIAPAD